MDVFSGYSATRLRDLLKRAGAKMYNLTKIGSDGPVELRAEFTLEDGHLVTYSMMRRSWGNLRGDKDLKEVLTKIVSVIGDEDEE